MSQEQSEAECVAHAAAGVVDLFGGLFEAPGSQLVWPELVVRELWVDQLLMSRKWAVFVLAL